MNFEDGVLLAGGLNNNHVYTSEQGLQIARVPRLEKDLVQEWQVSIYPYIGFFEDGGQLRIRSPQEQYDFSRKAAQEGLRVLAANDIQQGTVHMPLLPDTQHLATYLRTHPYDQVRIIDQLFTDLRRAHAKGFIYGDRYSPNMLIDHSSGKAPGLVHIDFDMEISGPTAKELEVAEVTRDVLYATEAMIKPLANWLGAPNAWFNLDVVAKYLSNFVAHWERDRFRRTSGDLVEQVLIESYAAKAKVATKVGRSSLAVFACYPTSWA